MDKVIIITGGAGGIGSDICRGLAADGYKVVIADYAKDAAEKTAAEIRRPRERQRPFRSTSAARRASPK